MEDFSFKYNFLIFAFSFVALFFAIESDVKRNNNFNIGIFFSVLFVILITVMFGFRDLDIGTDTEMYFYQYKNYQDIEMGTDFLMSYFYSFLNIFSKDPAFFFKIMATLYTATYSLALFNYSKKLESNVLLVIFSMVSFFFFQSMGINIIRQGVALSFFVLGISYYLQDSTTFYRKKVIIPLIVAVGFHFTALVPVLFFLFIVYFNRIKLSVFLYLYVITLVLSAFNVSVLIFKDYLNVSFFDERRSSYLDVSNFDGFYNIGFKPQFVVFNTVFLIVFLLIKKHVYSSKEYIYMLKYYLLSSSLFFMVFQLPYSDRWGIMSWVIIPFLLLPLFKNNNQYKLATFTLLFLTSIFIFFQFAIGK